MKYAKYVATLLLVAIILPLFLAKVASCSGIDTANQQAITIDSLRSHIESYQSTTLKVDTITHDSFIYQKVIKYVPKLVPVIVQRDSITHDTLMLETYAELVETIDTTISNKGTKVIVSALSAGRLLSLQYKISDAPCVPIYKTETKIEYVEKPRCGFFRKIFKKCN